MEHYQQRSDGDSLAHTVISISTNEDEDDDDFESIRCIRYSSRH